MGRYSSHFVDMAGQRVNRLLVLKRIDNNKYGVAMWLCRCDCGVEKPVQGPMLRSGKTKSCGCLQVEHARKQGKIAGESAFKHGLCETPEYLAWVSMRRRCSLPGHRQYPNYGARGITVCREWDESFEAFFSYVGKRPSNKHSLDRINNDGNYEHGNVRWATSMEQNNNNRGNRIVEFRGREMTLAQVYREASPNTSMHNFYVRLCRGWSLEEAIV